MIETPFDKLFNKVVDNRGKTCPTSSTGTPLIATNCIKNDQLYPVFERVRYVDDATMKNWFRGHPKPGNILFVTKGTPGRVAWVPDPVTFCIAQDMLALDVNDRIIYPKYLFAVLRSSNTQGEIENLHVGSLIPHFKKGDFNRLSIPTPDRKIQEFIGDLYFNSCLKIDLLHRNNRTLEDMAEALFRQWFVEDADESWVTGKLTDLIELNPKRSLARGSISPYLEMSNLSNEVYHPTNWYDREFTSGTKFINGDTLLARITPCLENGKTAFVDFLDKDQVGWGSTEYIVMRTKSGVHPFFAYVLARDSDFRAFAIGSMVGSSGRQRVDVGNISTYEMVIPPVDVVGRFNDFINPILERMKKSNNEIRTLSELRDILLPKLMSGEVSVNL